MKTDELMKLTFVYQTYESVRHLVSHSVAQFRRFVQGAIKTP
jgi:hypothetical protein